MKRVKWTATVGAVLTTAAVAPAVLAGAAQSNPAPGFSDPSAARVVSAETQGAPRFEFAVTHYVVRSCYFEPMNRQGAIGPFKFDGKGNSKQAAERNADGKANAEAGRQGLKLKHCRTQSHTSKR